MKVKPAVIALIMLGVYIISTFAYVGLQSFRSYDNTDSNIIKFRLDNYTRYNIIQQGGTIITFEYDGKCANCDYQKYFLEKAAGDYKNQLILEEILNSTFTSSKLTIVSRYGNKTFTDPTENETYYALCDLLSMPPTICVTGK